MQAIYNGKGVMMDYGDGIRVTMTDNGILVTVGDRQAAVLNPGGLICTFDRAEGVAHYHETAEAAESWVDTWLHEAFAALA